MSPSKSPEGSNKKNQEPHADKSRSGIDGSASSQAITASLSDKYLWLENVQGEKALSWVKAHNKKSLNQLESYSGYKEFYKQALNIVNDKDRLALGEVRGNYVYNFWQDEKNVRGLWRRTTVSSYKSKRPEWENLLSIDELAKAEKENWVFKGSQCLYPDYNSCLLRLSRGGGDAVVVREFDTNTREFVPGGFNLPENKSYVEWVNHDVVLVSTNYGKDSLTNSGYPRFIKVWERGTPLDQAPTIAEAPKTHISAWSWQDPVSGHLFVGKSMGMDSTEYYFVEKDKDWQLILLPLPEDADLTGLFSSQMILRLRSDWKIHGQTYPEGAVVSFSFEQFLKTGKLPRIQTLFIPNRREGFQSLSITKNAVYISVLEDVKGRIFRYSLRGGHWEKGTVRLPPTGAIEVVGASPDSDEVFFLYEDFLTPKTLYFAKDTSLQPHFLRKEKSYFSTHNLKIYQYFVKSKDGTRVPYFVIGPKHSRKMTPHKTLLTAYGGFEISWTPSYDPVLGKLWLENGGVFVVANIRGGGEYGPRWHKEALKTHRMRAYEDFFAVAEDLIYKNITTSDLLGIRGGSNGGLLMGVAYTKYPELFSAVICNVPLLDMIRYSQLAAGASWISEYGDPNVPEERKNLLEISPYHNIQKNNKYPIIYFQTSTKDDRVHPGHARKMAAKLEDLGKNFLYYENIDGGHSAAANREERARRNALEYSFLMDVLKDEK